MVSEEKMLNLFNEYVMWIHKQDKLDNIFNYVYWYHEARNGKND